MLAVDKEFLKVARKKKSLARSHYSKTIPKIFYYRAASGLSLEYNETIAFFFFSGKLQPVTSIAYSETNHQITSFFPPH